MVDRWISNVSQMPGIWAFDDEEGIVEYMRNLQWSWDPNDREWGLTSREYPPDGPFPSSESNLREYKKRCWRAGILDHEDVLYFAVRILDENPGLTRFFSARYPYVFVDEFQDTTPAQTEVLRKLAAAGSVTGVIGDIEQSIFEFAGADPEDLRHFEPTGQETYQIVSNRRSTEQIVDLLNHVRQQADQETYTGGKKAKEGPPPVVLVGPPETAREHVESETEEKVQTLVRNNDLVRRLAGTDLPGGGYDDSWAKLRNKNPYRTEWLEAVLESVREGQNQDRYGSAVQILYRGLRTQDGKLLSKVFTESKDRSLSREDRRRTAATLLPLLLGDVDRYQEMSGLEFYRSVRKKMLEILPNTPMVNPGGRYAELLEETSYEELYATARLRSGDGQVKTVHKSKGEEYPVVLVHRGSREGESDDTISHLLTPKEIGDQEERRVTYVGLSRAEDRLYICVEKLSENKEAQLEDLGLVVQRLDESPGHD
ncbi:DNA helicase-2/ATP-dependent DNA helicase PcrA [Salinibacter ruber]|nr:DNA helicase-2/ATP-dependent DNA helicase PcrA [Salinibacter ruber]